MAKKTTAQSKTENIFAVVGSDESEVKRAALELSTRLATGGEFGSDIIDGCADNVEQATTRIHQAIEALLTLPFFGGEKLVWLKSANFLADNVMGRSNSVLEALEKLQTTLSAGLPENVRFLLSATEIDRRRSFYKTISKLAKVEEYDKIDSSRAGWEEECAQMIARRARDRRLIFQEDALELFTLLTGGETRQIENELEKLDLFLGEKSREISADEVRLLVPLSRGGVIFELGNAVAQREVRRSLALLDQLMHQGESAIGILLVAIIPTIRNLLIVKDLMEQHRLPRPQQPHFFSGSLKRLPESATDHLPRKKDGTVNFYALGIAACHVHRYKLDELRSLLDACLRANVQLVTSQLDDRVVLTELIARTA